MSPRRAKAVRGRVGDDPATALREHLIDTAEKLLGERQVSTITTRDIARSAGVSDGVLYNYFAAKHELLVAALVRRYAGSVTRFDTDLPVAGSGTVEDNLIAYAQAAVDLVTETLPTAAGLMSEPALLHRFIEEIHRQPFGPHRLRQPISDYLAAEQQLGRLGTFDIEAAISLIMGPAIMLGFAALISGASQDELTEQIPGIVRTLLTGIQAGGQ
ncbi:TetR/AcrR family transcriptional regulator [Kribbella sp. NPDC050124]|uniref:TetR/AcrR family transcriptional regulator n=1 Tax=Kribbella sp. NPDC050124 TaxID=3364114 RepID=UPI0037A8B717